MSIRVLSNLDLSQNTILNVSQGTDPNNVVIIAKLQEELNKKADIIHTHEIGDVNNIEFYLTHQTLDGGLL
jgi:hypothetical protein